MAPVLQVSIGTIRKLTESMAGSRRISSIYPIGTTAFVWNTRRRFSPGHRLGPAEAFDREAGLKPAVHLCCLFAPPAEAGGKEELAKAQLHVCMVFDLTIGRGRIWKKAGLETSKKKAKSFELKSDRESEVEHMGCLQGILGRGLQNGERVEVGDEQARCVR